MFPTIPVQLDDSYHIYRIVSAVHPGRHTILPGAYILLYSLMTQIKEKDYSAFGYIERYIFG